MNKNKNNDSENLIQDSMIRRHSCVDVTPLYCYSDGPCTDYSGPGRRYRAVTTVRAFFFLRRSATTTFAFYRHSSSRSEWLPHLTSVILPDWYTYISRSSLRGEHSAAVVVPFTFVRCVRVEHPLFHSDSVVDRTDGDRPWWWWRWPAIDLPKRPRRKCRNLMRNSRLNFSWNTVENHVTSECLAGRGSVNAGTRLLACGGTGLVDTRVIVSTIHYRYVLWLLSFFFCRLIFR